MSWLIENKDWVFSGVGATIIGCMLSRCFKSYQSQKSGSNSTNYQASGDIKIGQHDDK